jgi:septal ring factor EnvC (AmiA/AmiB activator)
MIFPFKRMINKGPMLSLFFCITSQLVAQSDYQDRLRDMEDKLSNLQSEYESIQRRENDFFAEVEKSDKKINLFNQQLRVHREEESRLGRAILAARKREQDLLDELGRLRQAYAQQAVVAYIQQRRKNDFFRLDFSKPLTTIRDLRLFSIISEHEAKLGQQLLAQSEELSTLQKTLGDELAARQRVLVEVDKKITRLTATRRQKREAIRKLQSDLQARELAIQRMRSARDLLLDEIRKANVRSDANAVERTWVDTQGSFVRNKGKFNWPVNGQILTRFGKYRDPVLKTTLTNTGIDIGADFGQDVRAIHAGRVSLITFLSGYGNTIIVDHGNNYYSVYSHVNEIYVSVGEAVNSGKRLASVGDSGSLSGPKLHFEIYAGQQPVNPQKWLRD